MRRQRLVQTESEEIVNVLFVTLLSAWCWGAIPADRPVVSPSNSSREADGLIPSPEPDWPQWRGKRRDGISEEHGLLQAWPEGGPRLRWKIEGLGKGWSSPVVVGGRLFITGDVGEDLVVFAFDLTGKPRWRTVNGRSWTASYPGARACCAYSDGRLYHLNAHGRVACLDAASGQEVWAVDLRQRFQTAEITWGLSECLLIDGPRLIVTPASPTALMAALDKQTGQTVWTTEPLHDDQVTHSSPILFRCAGKRILANCSSGHGFGVDADTGKLLWTVPLPSPYKVNVATPVYGDGQIFYVTPYIPGACYRLQFSSDGVRAEEAWTTSLDTCTGGLLLLDGLLCGSGYKKHKSWLCLDWRTGEPRHEFKGLTTSSAIYADGRLYCLAEDGRAALLKPSPEKLELVGQFFLVPETSSDAWAHPVLLDGRLYLRYHDVLWCYDVQKE